MIPHVKNVILASADQVAIDAVAARMMGFDPLRIKYIRLAHDAGLGCGDVRNIEIAGDPSAAEENWRFEGPFAHMTFASRMQHRIYWGPLKSMLEWSLKTVLAPWAYAASVLYHDTFWYPTHQKVIRDALASDWGRLFADWESLQLSPDDLETPGWSEVGGGAVRLRRTGFGYLLKSLALLAGCLKEAPEFAARRRRRRPGAVRSSAEGDQRK
ncbi:MAG TPA: hypothetical protein EYP62_07795 [Kiritimatiellae bacterium]|nr:hypothetical protein [Kiritimatiellia bacterium]